MNEWMNEWTNEQMNDGRTDERTNERASERGREWMNEWMNEWASERTSKWGREGETVCLTDFVSRWMNLSADIKLTSVSSNDVQLLITVQLFN